MVGPSPLDMQWQFLLTHRKNTAHVVLQDDEARAVKYPNLYAPTRFKALQVSPPLP